MTTDFDTLSLEEIEQKLLEAKELLRYLEETYPSFEPKWYLLGSELLQRSAAFVDDEIHNPTLSR